MKSAKPRHAFVRGFLKLPWPFLARVWRSGLLLILVAVIARCCWCPSFWSDPGRAMQKRRAV